MALVGEGGGEVRSGSYVRTFRDVAHGNRKTGRNVWHARMTALVKHYVPHLPLQAALQAEKREKRKKKRRKPARAFSHADAFEEAEAAMPWPSAEYWRDGFIASDEELERMEDEFATSLEIEMFETHQLNGGPLQINGEDAPLEKTPERNAVRRGRNFAKAARRVIRRIIDSRTEGLRVKAANRDKGLPPLRMGRGKRDTLVFRQLDTEISAGE